MSSSNPAEATSYLQVRLDRRVNHGTWPSAATVVAVTQKKPSQPKKDCIVVKVKLRIPVEGWDPFEPSAVIDVPADLVRHPRIDFEVDNYVDVPAILEEDADDTGPE